MDVDILVIYAKQLYNLDNINNLHINKTFSDKNLFYNKRVIITLYKYIYIWWLQNIIKWHTVTIIKVSAGFLRDKTMDDKFIYNPNDDNQNYTFSWLG